jgi:hypothetical protein
VACGIFGNPEQRVDGPFLFPSWFLSLYGKRGRDQGFLPEEAYPISIYEGCGTLYIHPLVRACADSLRP